MAKFNGKSVDNYRYHIIRTNSDGSKEIAAWYDNYQQAHKEMIFLRKHGRDVEIKQNF